MDEQIPSPLNENEPQSQTPPPASEDAQQFKQWMVEYGRPALIGLAVAVVVLLGIQVWRNQKESKAAAAVQTLFQSRSPEELQMLAAADPKAPIAPMALASAAAEFYAQNRYDEALAAYQSFLSQYPTNMLALDAAVGVAASQEALDDFETAAAGYEAIAAANTNSPLQPQAVMGAARCREQLGQFDAARALYEDFIAAHPDSTWLPQAESGLLFLKKAERAKNLPAPTPAAVFDSSKDIVVTEEPAAAVAVEAAPAAEAQSAVQSEPKQNKKKSSKKKAEKPAEENTAEESAPK